nr:hypothetical protein [Chlamydiota bacterium]
CLREIEKKAHFVHFVQAQREDTATPEDLERAFQLVSSCPYSLEESVTDGFQKAKAATGKKDILVVCGSFYIMKEANS